MEKTKQQQDRRNDARQSGAGGDLAYGQDARMFGEGGQKTQRALDPGKDDRPERDAERDESLPSEEHSSRNEQ